MNRSLLLVICDFLLLSMLAIARFEDPEEEVVEPEPEIVQDAPSPESELLELLQLSLQEEQQNQRELREQIDASAEAIKQREADMESAAAEIEAKEQALEEAAILSAEQQAALAAKDDELTTKAAEIAAKEREAIEQQALMEAERKRLEQTIANSQTSNQVTLERLRLAEQTIAQAEEQKAALAAEKESIEAEKRAVEERAQALTTELRVTETERNLIAKNLENAQIQLETVQIEKEALREQTNRLTEGVSTLAETSQEIRKEIQESQPLSPANIFSQYRDQQVEITWNAAYSGMFGRTRTVTTPGVLVNTVDGLRIVFLAEDTPFRPNRSTSVPSQLQASVRTENGITFQPTSVLFSTIDPRIGFIPVSRTQLPGGDTPIGLSDQPFRFDKAIVIRPENGNYGETGYKVSPQSDLVLDLDSRILSGLFGDFNAREGDFVFDLTGNLAAIMVNGDKAVRIASANSAHTIGLNGAYRAEQANATIQKMSERINRFPLDLR